MPDSLPHRIVFANEKGGTGKSTTAVHVAIALAYQGARVAALDLDPRQRTMFRYFENRGETERRRGIALPGARFGVFTGENAEELDRLAEDLGEGATSWCSTRRAATIRWRAISRPGRTRWSLR